MAGPTSPYLVEEERAAGSFLDQPALHAIGAGKGPALMAEEFGFEEIFLQTAAVDGDQFALRARTRSWIACATSSLPVPDSPSTQHGRVGRPDGFNQGLYFGHRTADEHERPGAVRSELGPVEAVRIAQFGSLKYPAKR
jgi:hypothetical protein